MSFDISRGEKDSCQYAVVTSRVKKLDATVTDELSEQFGQLHTQGTENIILDLTATPYCDSSGLSTILVATQQCKKAGGLLVLAGLHASVTKVITISRLHFVLNIQPTLADAVEMLVAESA